MKKIILFLMLLPIVSFSAIDECKTDIYFANGILTEKSDAKFNTQVVLEPEVISLYNSFKEYKQHIGKVALSYNKTKGFWLDGIETYLQKFGLQSLVDLLKDTAHKADLKTQIDTYKASIKSGHKVLVVAHSQGNLFTNEVYKKLLGHTTDWWMTRYFKVVSIASPMCFKITTNTQGISWDNDVVPNMVGLCSDFNVENNVRKVSWEFYDGTPRVARPNHNYIYRSQVGVVYKNSWKGIEEGNDENVHAFTFYMGKALKEGDKNKPNYDEIYLNPFDDKNITNDTAKDLIMTTIKSQIDELEKLSSQWIIDQEFDKNTCNYKITLKHQYDPSIEMGEKVYPFNASKKLYQVNGEWVKASCGGKNILPDWDGKQENECWMIDNPEVEKISRKDVPSNLYSGCYISGEIGIHSTSSGAATSCNSSYSIFKLTCFGISGNEGLIVEIDPPCMGVAKVGASYAENLDELVVILDEWWQGVHSGFKVTATAYTESQHQRILDEYGKDTYEVSDIYSFKTCNAFRGGIGCSYYTPAKVYNIK